MWWGVELKMGCGHLGWAKAEVAERGESQRERGKGSGRESARNNKRGVRQDTWRQTTNERERRGEEREERREYLLLLRRERERVLAAAAAAATAAARDESNLMKVIRILEQ